MATVGRWQTEPNGFVVTFRVRGAPLLTAIAFGVTVLVEFPFSVYLLNTFISPAYSGQAFSRVHLTRSRLHSIPVV